MNVTTAEKAVKAFLPNPSFLAKKIPTWKLTVREWNSDEFKTQVAALFDELNEQYGWVQEKQDYAEEQAFLAYKKGDKEKLRAKTSEVMVLEKKIALIEHVSPMVEKVQENSKTLRKEKKCPEDVATEVATIVYLADVFSIPAFQRVKHQLSFKYGEKYIEKVCGKKHVNVDEEVVKMVEYAPESKEVKARAKADSEKYKERAKKEEKEKEEAAKAKEKAKKGKSHKHHHHKKDSSDSESEESSEEEKPKKKSKKSKKESSSDSSESSEEEKPKKSKKSKKESSSESSEEEKPKKSKKVKKAEATDSESEEEKPKEEKPKEEEKPASA
ncbi:hypothetical protein AV274_2670 [Blastocystis sp. ATCC 50177/Nand II]|uniref:Uncharacterized protein n=2 Tax=Blastocystis sp. subtype 1 (strain ATCC 50177 / NandII) TaxID=478820 RepID=A0A196SH09_BLAHN|nr:hypothetical protein AV274_2670 [Blastocystis sp. ATCC 50177/Nand II]